MSVHDLPSLPDSILCLAAKEAVERNGTGSFGPYNLTNELSATLGEFLADAVWPIIEQLLSVCPSANDVVQDALNEMSEEVVRRASE